MPSGQRYEPPAWGRRLFSRWAGLVGLLLVIGSGCGGGPQNEAVSGSVTWKGQPLDQGTIEFVPAGQGVPVGGVILNGRYQFLSTPGVPPGTYQVRISSRKGKASRPDIADFEMSDPTVKEQIPAKYNVKTELKAEVKRGGGNTFDFDLQ
jgi:hypothetical protein